MRQRGDKDLGSRKQGKAAGAGSEIAHKACRIGKGPGETHGAGKSRRSLCRREGHQGVHAGLLPEQGPLSSAPAAENFGQDTQQILVKDLKAVFFVKDFDGNPAYDERRRFSEGDKAQGRKMEILFKDGEKLVGATLGYEPNRPGFFINPVDGKSNNIRVFVVQSSVEKLRNL